MAKQINHLDSGNLEDLQPGETLLVQLIPTSTGKGNFQVEIAEIIQRQPQGSNLLAALNEGDDRFTSGKPRRAWETCTLKGLCKMFDLDPKEVKSKARKQKTSKGKAAYRLNVLNPVFSDKGVTKQFEGQRARLQITESVNPTDWQMENYETSAKQVNGEYITHQGMAVFTQGNMVAGEPNHTFLDSDRTISNKTNGPIILKEMSAPSKTYGDKPKNKKKKKKNDNPFSELDS